MFDTVPDRRKLTENAALNVFLKRSALRSLSVPVTCSLLGYFCPVLYLGPRSCQSSKINNPNEQDFTVWLKKR